MWRRQSRERRWLKFAHVRLIAMFIARSSRCSTRHDKLFFVDKGGALAQGGVELRWNIALVSAAVLVYGDFRLYTLSLHLEFGN